MPPKKILLAEDDRDDRDFFYDAVKGRGDVAMLPAAENGEEVLAALASGHPGDGLPDLILLDQNMPKQNGLQTLQLLKQNESYRTIPVFVYSTYADEMLTERSLAAGAASVFAKPFTLEGYRQLVDEMLAKVS